MLALLLACTPEPDPSATLLASFSFGWSAFNHRLSHLGVEAAEESATLAVVGGTSTTGVVPTYEGECDPDTCAEFPFTDTAEIGGSVIVLSDPDLIAATGSATLEANAAGGFAGVTLPWSEVPSDFTPVITGLVLESAGGDGGCYDPDFGWLPTQLTVAVERDGDNALLSATFAAGLTLEAERACLDVAAPSAAATFTVTVTAIAGLEAQSATLDQTASYEDDGEPQIAPSAVSLDLPAARAFRSLDFRFHEGDAEGRGAYLRTLSAHTSGSASATNYSPGTQLSGFQYAFGGEVVGFEAAAVETLAFSATYTPTLTDAGAVVATSAAYAATSSE